MADVPLNLFLYFVFYWRDCLIVFLACMLFVLVVLHFRGPRSFRSFSSVVSEADRSFDALTNNVAPNIRARASLDATDLADRPVSVPRQRVHRPTFSTPMHDDAPPIPTFSSSSNLITQPSVCLPSLPEFWDSDPAGFFKVCENLFEASSVTDETLRYRALLSSFSKSSSLLKRFSDLLPSSDTEHSYSTLKTRILDRFS